MVKDLLIQNVIQIISQRFFIFPVRAVFHDIFKHVLNFQAQYASTEPITTDGNVYNIMLVGLDTTDKGWIGNSDSMILISVNYRLEQISMISLMRDTHVMIPGIGYRKLNATYPNQK